MSAPGCCAGSAGGAAAAAARSGSTCCAEAVPAARPLAALLVAAPAPSAPAHGADDSADEDRCREGEAVAQFRPEPVAAERALVTHVALAAAAFCVAMAGAGGRNSASSKASAATAAARADSTSSACSLPISSCQSRGAAGEAASGMPQVALLLAGLSPRGPRPPRLLRPSGQAAAAMPRPDVPTPPDRSALCRSVSPQAPARC